MSKNIFNKLSKKVFVGIVPIIFVGVFLCVKPVVKNIFVESSKYKTPANTAFSDIYFYKCVVANYNNENHTNLNYEDTNLTDEQLAAITRLECKKETDETYSNITYTNGIEKLVNLKSINLISNNISEIDVSRFNLTHLVLNGSNIESIDLSNNSSLGYVQLRENKLKNITLPNEDKIYFLDIAGNELENIDLSNKSELVNLNVSSNKLTTLNLNNDPKLKTLDADRNSLENIYLNGDTSLTQINAMYNQLQSIDLSANTSLYSLWLLSNKLESLDLSNNALLRSVKIDGNKLNQITFNDNTNLQSLDISANNFSNIDFIKKFTDLEYLAIDNNPNIKFDLSNNTKLVSLSSRNCNLDSIDLSKNVLLESLFLEKNNLINIDISNNVNLKQIVLSENHFKYIDASNNPLVTSILLENQTSGKMYLFKETGYEIDDQVLLDLATQDSGIDVDGNTLTFKNSYYNYTLYANNIFYYDLAGGEKKYFDYRYEFKVDYIYSSKYKIDNKKSTIFTEMDTDVDEIMSNVHNMVVFDEPINDTYIENNKYIVKHDDNIIKEFDIVNYSSNEYDMSKKYLVAENPLAIYTDYVSGRINCTNCRVDYDSENNKIQIKHNDDGLKQFDYVGYSSDKYNMSGDSISVSDQDIASFLNNINCINCEAYVYDGNNNRSAGTFADDYTLRILYYSMGSYELVKEFNLIYSPYSVNLSEHNIDLNLSNNKTYQLSANVEPDYALNKNVIWSSNDDSIVTVDENGLVTAVGVGQTTITVTTEEGGYTDTCSVVVNESLYYSVMFMDGDTVIKILLYKEGDNVNLILGDDAPTRDGYILYKWKLENKEYDLSSTYTMPNHDIVFQTVWRFLVPKINDNYIVDGNVLSGISNDTFADSINLGLSDIYEYTILNNNDDVKIQEKIGTGDKIKIKLKSDGVEVVTYTVSVKGDLNGDGEISVSDISMIYKNLKRKNEFSSAQSIAANVNGDNSVSVSDISILYKVLKRKINL